MANFFCDLKGWGDRNFLHYVWFPLGPFKSVCAWMVPYDTIYNFPFHHRNSRLRYGNFYSNWPITEAVSVTSEYPQDGVWDHCCWAYHVDPQLSGALRLTHYWVRNVWCCIRRDVVFTYGYLGKKADGLRWSKMFMTNSKTKFTVSCILK